MAASLSWPERYAARSRLSSALGLEFGRWLRHDRLDEMARLAGRRGDRRGAARRCAPRPNGPGAEPGADPGAARRRVLARASPRRGRRRGNVHRGRRPAPRRGSLPAERAARRAAARARSLAHGSPPSRARAPRQTPRPPPSAGARATLRGAGGLQAQRARSRRGPGRAACARRAEPVDRGRGPELRRRAGTAGGRRRPRPRARRELRRLRRSARRHPVSDHGHPPVPRPPLRPGAGRVQPLEAPRVARRFRAGPARPAVAGQDRRAEAGRPGRRHRRARGRSGSRGPGRARARAEPPRGRRRRVAGRAARGGARGDRATLPARRDPAAQRAPADRPRRRRRLDSVHREPAAGGGVGRARRRGDPRDLRAHAGAVVLAHAGRPAPRRPPPAAAGRRAARGALAVRPRSGRGPAALDNVRLPALVSRLLFDRITHWPRSSPKSEGRDVPESSPSRRLSMNRPALSSVIAFAVVLGLAATAQAQSGWPVYGGDPGNTRYSTLTQINPGDVKNLKVAWVLQLGSLRSQESTPLVIGDTLYVTSSHGPKNVFAVDAKTGVVRWRYSPEVPAGIDQYACCDVNNRGVAYANGRVFVGRLDGALVALDAATGKEVWKTQVVDHTQGSVITSPPTPALNLIYYGTSNPAPWNAAVRGPDSSNYGQFTNLFSSSTVALDADTGKLAWFYQSTPHDAWDYDGVNENVLADVEINGQKTPVLFKADRNGFFYVLNRKTGQLISAKLFATANWTSGMDMTTGRPIEVPEKRPRVNFRAKDVGPSAIGLLSHGDTHGWFKALDAKTGQTLWQFMAGSGISAAPMTYAIDGKQYVAVVSGRTFAIPPFFGKMGEQMVAASPEGGALFVFELPSP